MATSLVSTISSMVAAITPSNGKAPFANVNAEDLTQASTGQVLMFVLVFAFSVWLLMFLGAWIFNSSIPKIFPAANKVTVLQFFGLYIICHILFT